MHTRISACRVCGNPELVPVLDLGQLAMTGIFPRDPDRSVGRMPLELVKCHGDGETNCGLLQLRHSGDIKAMYGDNYGYRSGLNESMVKHLRSKVARILKLRNLQSGDLVVDIGSNDGTTLSAYPSQLQLVGMDPTGNKFRRFYPPHVILLPEFYSARALRGAVGSRKAKVVTSFAMFYDLEDPLGFMKEVHEVLDDDGVWELEQSYMPAMLRMTSYDTVCHEHLEYYSLSQLQWMAERTGFKLLDVEFNTVNGGSFSVDLVKNTHAQPKPSPRVDEVLAAEAEGQFETLEPYLSFSQRTLSHRDVVNGFFKREREKGKLIIGYGASTKGNVLLQWCGLRSEHLPCIADVNPDKFGCFTPGSAIPIVSEEEARAMHPSGYFVLPWHFREQILERERDFRRSGGKIIFPLPELDEV